MKIGVSKTQTGIGITGILGRPNSSKKQKINEIRHFKTDSAHYADTR